MCRTSSVCGDERGTLVGSWAGAMYLGLSKLICVSMLNTPVLKGLRHQSKLTPFKSILASCLELGHQGQMVGVWEKDNPKASTQG